MGIVVSYNTLAQQLEKELVITVTVLETATKFKKKLSQAKFRQGIEGKLIFGEVQEVKNAEGDTATTLTVALEPKKNTVTVLQVDKSTSI